MAGIGFCKPAVVLPKSITAVCRSQSHSQYIKNNKNFKLGMSKCFLCAGLNTERTR